MVCGLVKDHKLLCITKLLLILAIEKAIAAEAVNTFIFCGIKHAKVAQANISGVNQDSWVLGPVDTCLTDQRVDNILK